MANLIEASALGKAYGPRQVLHEITLALMADEVVVMQQGRTAHTGPTHDPAAHRALEAVFEHRIAIHPLGPRWVALPR